MERTKEWYDWLWPADDWLISYALPTQLIHVQPFSIFQAVELYLKAVYTKQTSDMQKARSFGHDIVRLLHACQRTDPRFLANYEIRDDVIAATKHLRGSDPDLLPEEIRESYAVHFDFYQIARLNIYMRYLAGPFDPKDPELRFAFGSPSRYWIPLVRDMRTYLNYPDEQHYDPIQDHVQRGHLPPEAITYLMQLY